MKKSIKKIIGFLGSPKEKYANWSMFKYYALKAGKKMGLLKSPDEQKLLSRDMFDWSLYNNYYRGEMKLAAKEYTLCLKTGDYNFTNRKLLKSKDELLPLHPNWRLLYETILQLNPSSVFELGSGNGIHLYNLQILKQGLSLAGIDLLPEQIKYMKETYPGLVADVWQADATVPISEDKREKYDLAFTQAVTMHIHTDDLHLEALSNMFKVAKKQVVLVERWKNHPYLDDIKKLQLDGKIKWDKIYFYYRIDEETKASSLIICSNELLDYPVLDNYNLLPIV